jgi:uncharacterized Rmd1/YagE family protein
VNHEPSEQDVEDTYNINIVDKAEISIAYTRATLPEFNIDYIRIIALILAESVAMESFENSTEAILDKSLEYSRQLKRQGIYPKNHKDLLRFIGFVLTTRQEILSNLYISSAPDETWNNQVLEKMFIQLKDMFDIEQRFRALNMSLNSIQESIEVMTDLLQNRKSQMLEWLIIALIFAEILMSIGGYIF